MKKLLSIVLAIVFTAALLSGCGGGNKPVEQAASTAAPVSTGEKKQDVPAEEVTIKSFAHMTDPVKLQGYNEIIDAFKKSNPGINVVHEDMDFNNYNTTLKTRLAAGDAPDLLYARPVEKTDLINAGQIEDITDKVDFSNISPEDKNAATVNGRVYGIPMDIATRAIMYNKDMFQQAGVEIPKTQSDFVKLLETLKAKGIKPILMGYKDVGFFSTVGWACDFFGGPLMKNPAFFADVMSRSKKFSDYPDFKSSLQRYANYMSYANEDAFSIDYATELSKFAAGEYAMIIQGTWAPGTIVKNNPQGNFGAFPLPTSDNPAENAINTLVDDSFMMSSQSSHKDEAAKFMSFIISKDGGNIWVRVTGNISVVQGLTEQCSNPIIKDIQAYIAKGEWKTMNAHSITNFSGKYVETFNSQLEQFGADKNHDADAIIKTLDEQFDKFAGK